MKNVLLTVSTLRHDYRNRNLQIYRAPLKSQVQATSLFKSAYIYATAATPLTETPKSSARDILAKVIS